MEDDQQLMGSSSDDDDDVLSAAPPEQSGSGSPRAEEQAPEQQAALELEIEEEPTAAESSDAWQVARAQLRERLRDDEPVTIVLVCHGPATGHPSRVYLDTEEWLTTMSPADPPDPFGRPADKPLESRVVLNMGLFRSEVALTCPGSVLKRSCFFERGAEASEDWLEESKVGRTRVVVAIDHGCCAGDVSGMAAAMELLCSGAPPALETETLIPTMLAGHVLGNDLATRQCAARLGQHLSVDTLVLALRCADFCGSSRLLKHCFYFLRYFFMTQGCQGELLLADGTVVHRETGCWALTWPLTTAAMEYERRLEALGVYSTSEEVRKCYVHRIKKANDNECNRYALHVDSGTEHNGSGFMLSAFEVNPRTHIISISRLEAGADVSAANDGFVACVESNFLGTEFTVYDHGVDPQVVDPTCFPARPRLQLATVQYGSNRIITLPREMTVDVAGDEIENVPPKWSERHNCYMLNFSGRVKKASVKNFILSPADNPDHQILLFGKVNSERFSCDFRHPLSPCTAFAIALSSLTRKMAVT